MVKVDLLCFHESNKFNAGIIKIIIKEIENKYEKGPILICLTYFPMLSIIYNANNFR